MFLTSDAFHFMSESNRLFTTVLKELIIILKLLWVIIYKIQNVIIRAYKTKLIPIYKIKRRL